MKKIIKTLANYMNSNNAWTFLVLLGFISTMWVMTFHYRYLMWIYQEPVKWVLALKLFGALLIVFSPVILFSALRNQIRQWLPLTAYYILQGVIFVGYPFLLFFTDFQMKIIPVPMLSEIPTVIGIFILCTEVITSPNFLPQKINLDEWKKKVSPEWIVIALFFTLSLIRGNGIANEDSGAFNSWLQRMIVVSMFYIFYLINHYFLINKIYKEKGLFYYGFSFLGLGILFYYPISMLMRFLPAYRGAMNYMLGSEWVGENAPTAFWALPVYSILYLMLLTIPLTILVQWIQQSKKIYNLEEEKNNAELNLLKQQINPHFFFNTLNNLYSMSLKKNKNTSEGILQLSDLMRYVIYKGKEEKVTLQEEIKYVEDYINLQKMRLYQNLDLKFDINIHDADLMITPLLLIIPIENAFKHGIEGSEDDGFLHITLDQTGNSLILKCKNSIENSIQKTRENGLGLQNLRKRLELIYPDCYELTIIENEKDYHFTMRLDL